MNKFILILVLVATSIGLFFSTNILSSINQNIASTKEAARPANIKITKISTPDCSDCFDIDKAIADLKALNVNVEEEKTLTLDSPETAELITQLSLQKLPTYLVTGEITKNNLVNFVKSNGEVTNDTFVFTKITPVYVETESQNEIGKVTATILTNEACKECLDPQKAIDNFVKLGVKIVDQQEVAWNSPAGQNLIRRYKITKVPTFIFSPEFEAYDAAETYWKNFGSVNTDGAYIADKLIPPYLDLSNGRVEGLVDAIYLDDSSCSDCYKVKDLQRPPLVGYGVALRSERVVDISSPEGKQLIAKYEITKVPTVLLSPEVSRYIDLSNIWKTVGEVKTDGWHLFTEMNRLGGSVIYKDLTTDKVIKPTEE